MNEAFEWASRDSIPVIRPGEPHLMFHSGPMFPKKRREQKEVNHEVVFSGTEDVGAKNFMRKGFSGVFGSRLDSIWSYKKYTKTDPSNVFAYDLETLGADNQIVEMAFQSKSGQVFHRFVQPQNVSSIEQLLGRYKADPMSIHRMTSTEQRTIADLVRYSTVGENAFDRAGSVHNRAVDSLFRGESLYVNALANNKFIHHMESGLEQIKTFDAPNTVAAELQTILDPDNLYIGHNSRKFDMPLLKDFMQSNGQTWRGMTNHLDTYDLLKTVFPTMHKILKEKGKPGVKMGDQKLQALVEMFSLESEAHSALGDTGQGGLLGALDELRPYVDDALDTAEFYEAKLQGKIPNELQLSNFGFGKGDLLYSPKGWTDRDDALKLDAEGNVLPDERFALNSRTVLAFDGFEEVFDKDGNKGVAAVFYDDLDPTQRGAIFRFGDTAYGDLQESLSKLIPMQFIDERTEQLIQHQRLEDLARRRYEGLFGLTNRGKVNESGMYTQGYQGAKRMYMNTEAMVQLMQEGLTEEEAIQKLNFNSQWDAKSKQFVYNEAEARDFKMLLPRLKSELPTVNAIIDQIETSFAGALEKATTDEEIRSVRQQMEETFFRTTQVALPDKTVTMKPMPGQERFYFFNPLTGGEASVSTASPEALLKDLNRLTRLNDDDMERIAGKTKLDGQQLKDYVKEEAQILERNRSMVIARAMNSQGGNAELEGLLEEAFDMYGDQYNLKRRIAEVTQPVLPKEDIQVRSIQPDSQNTMNPRQAALIAGETASQVEKMHNGMEILPKEVIGSKVRYAATFDGVLDQLDANQPQAPGSDFNWNAKHRQSLERILVSLEEANLQYSVDFSEGSGSLKIIAYTSDKADEVRAGLAKGEISNNAALIDLPYIEDGKMKSGRRELNARPSLRYDNGEMRVVSPIEEITDSIMGRMRSFISAVHDGAADRADQIASRAIDDAVSGYAGSQGIFGANDTLEANQTLADRNKQYSIDTSDYVLKKMLADGTITEKDFYPDVKVYDENGKITTDILTMEHVSSRSMQRVYEGADEVLQDAGIKAYYGGVKSDHAGRLILGQQDVREYIPGGTYMNPGRDNPIQWLNVFELDTRDVNEMGERLRATGAYFSSDALLVTELGDEFTDDIRSRGKQTTFSVKAVHMSPQEIRDRMVELAGDESVQGRLIDEGYLVKPDDMISVDAQRFNIGGEDYILNPTKHPSTWENSGIMSEEIGASRERKKRVLDGHYEMDEGIGHGQQVKPGQRIGRQMGEDGRYYDVFWENKQQGVAHIENGEVTVRYNDEAFKWMADTEKFTEQKHSQWLIGKLAGDDEVALIMNPDIVKHQDWGIWANGRMRTVAEEMRTNAGDWDVETMLRVGQKLYKAGYEWDFEKGRMIDKTGELSTFDPANVQAIFDDDAFRGLAQAGRETFIVDMAASDVGDYSKIVGQEGRQVIGQTADGEDILGKFDGVKLGWRELNVLQEQGLGNNREALMDSMIQSAVEEKEGVVRTSALQRMQNTSAVFEATLNGIDAPTMQVRDFNDIPLDMKNEDAYKGTIFDIEGKGVYLELPTVEGIDGKTINYTYEAGTSRDGLRKELDGNRIFIPNTGLDGIQGQRYMDNLNGQIANIYKRASEVEKATSVDVKRAAQQELQSAIDGFFGKVTHDLTSSKGHMAQNVSTAKVAGVSGLLKMVDPFASHDIQGDFEFLTENQAKAMGIFEKLQAGDDVFGQSLRYPSFHGDSMVAVKYALGGTDDRYLLGTAFTGFLERGDQDGDQKHNFIISQTDEAQAELRQRWETQRGAENARYDAFMQKVRTQEPGFDWRTILGDDVTFQQMGGNTDEEIAAKIGKRLVGMTSNLNLQMRQLADSAFEAGSEQQQLMYTLGETIEQKLISSKHGLNAVDGRLPAIAFMDALKQNTVESHQQAIDIATEFIGQDFVDKTNLSAALDATRQAVGIAEVNLRNPAFQIGSSGGVTADISMEELNDVIMGDPGSNSLHQQFHRGMDTADALYGTIDQGSVSDPIQDEFIEEGRRRRRGGGPGGGGPGGGGPNGPGPTGPPMDPGGGGGGGYDGGSGGYPPAPPGPPDPPDVTHTLDDMADHMKRNKKAYLLGGAVAAGAALFSGMQGPNNFAPPAQKSSNQEYASQYETSRGQQIIAQARGKMPTERIEGQVKAWTDGNMNVERKDNTKKLNPMFYRDQVEGYI